MARFFCESMSPTPAVLGLPPSRAEAFIRRAEPWDRGLYAAPVGVINGKGCELIVALRAAASGRKRPKILDRSAAHVQERGLDMHVGCLKVDNDRVKVMRAMKRPSFGTVEWCSATPSPEAWA